MGLASPPMGLASPPSRPRLTPRRTRRGLFVAGGERRAVGAKNQNTATQPGGRLRFRVAREIFKFFLGACNGYDTWLVSAEETTGDLVRFRTGSRVVCRQGSALTAQTDARVNVRRASNLLPHDGFTVRPAPARSAALSGCASARPSRPLVPLFPPRLVRQHLSHDGCPPPQPRGTRLRAYRALARSLRPRGPDASDFPPRARSPRARARYRARLTFPLLSFHPEHY